MSRFALLAVIAIVIFLVGASVVLAQDVITGPGQRGTMMQSPGPDGTWEDMQQMHDAMSPYVPEGMREMHNAMGEAMQNGNWEQMHNTCQNYWNSQQDGEEGPDAPPAVTRGYGPPRGAQTT